jgi:hypothetical protein
MESSSAMSLDPDRFPEPEPFQPPSPALERLRLPAIFLIIVGCLNVLLSAYVAFNALAVSFDTERFMAEFEDKWKEQHPDQPLPITLTSGSVKSWSMTFLVGMGVGVLCAVVTIIAATRMLAGRHYGFALFGAVLAALPIPCVSCTGCCGLGEAIGIWAIVVLLNEQVKASFR